VLRIPRRRGESGGFGAKMADTDDITEFLVQTARLGLTGRSQDVQVYLRRVIKSVGGRNEELTRALADLLAKAPSHSAPMRDAGAPMLPVDADSRLALLKVEYPAIPETELILDSGLQSRLDQVVAEREMLSELEKQGLSPTRSLLLVGPPGVGKTLSARWLANRLSRPLLTLDLATVMSSFLGKTGSNIRAVLDYAKSSQSVLLLDEFDSIAKRRDDDSDVGELKRLVTVILQEIDDWPSTSILVAATNHGDLLDPAVWRRFDDVLEYATPDNKQSTIALKRVFEGADIQFDEWLPLLVRLWKDKSYSDITRNAKWIKRRSITTGLSLEEALFESFGHEIKLASGSDRKSLVPFVAKSKIPERRLSQLTGFSRDTIRKYRHGAAPTSQ
jgi:hypothetical protein